MMTKTTGKLWQWAQIAWAHVTDAVDDALEMGPGELPDEDEGEGKVMATTVDVACEPPTPTEPAPPRSELLVNGPMAVLTLAPQPLTPRPIEGNEVRVLVALPLRSDADLVARLAMGHRANARTVLVGKPS